MVWSQHFICYIAQHGRSDKIDRMKTSKNHFSCAQKKQIRMKQKLSTIRFKIDKNHFHLFMCVAHSCFCCLSWNRSSVRGNGNRSFQMLHLKSWTHCVPSLWTVCANRILCMSDAKTALRYTYNTYLTVSDYCLWMQMFSISKPISKPKRNEEWKPVFHKLFHLVFLLLVLHTVPKVSNNQSI